MPLSEHNWERFFQKQCESKEDFEIKPDKAVNALKNKASKVPAKVIKPILPFDAHRIALEMISNQVFLIKLKRFIAELIVNKQNVTRIDFEIEKESGDELLQMYGLTKQHFKDIANGNLTSFDLAPDGEDLAIFFKRDTGESAIRPIDNAKLAEMLNIIFKSCSNFSPPSLRTDINTR